MVAVTGGAPGAAGGSSTSLTLIATAMVSVPPLPSSALTVTESWTSSRSRAQPWSRSAPRSGRCRMNQGWEEFRTGDYPGPHPDQDR